MAELEDFHPPTTPPPAPPSRYPPADPARMARSLLDEQVELWWFGRPRRAALCYVASLALTLGCGLGGVGLLSTTTSLSSEWRLGTGAALCLLALAVLLKQLLSSAVQDMNCVRSRRRIEALRSGGLADLLLLLAAGLALTLCGAVLLQRAFANHMPAPGRPLHDMFVSGVVLLAVGGAVVLAAAAYAAVGFLQERTARFPGRRRLRGERGGPAAGVFTVSGQMGREARRETTSSLAQLI